MPPANRHNPQRAKSSTSDYSVTEFLRDFPDDAACLEHLWRTRYAADGEHAHCPRCDCRRVFKRYETKQQRQSWTCTGCGHHVHPTAGTIFHRSSTSLRLWFHAMYLMTSTRCGISAKQLERELGVHYKTAWRMFNRIRNELMKDDAGPLNGNVEIDETGVHGRAPWAENDDEGSRSVARAPGFRAGHGRTWWTGQVARDHVPARRAVKWSRAGQRQPGIDHLHRPYKPLSREYAGHRVINHSAGSYVIGDIYTNTIEGFFGNLKTGMRGTYKKVSRKWLQSYLDEYVWRYNQRRNHRGMFFALLDNAAK